jgi:hypothetical protein
VLDERDKELDVAVVPVNGVPLAPGTDKEYDA